MVELLARMVQDRPLAFLDVETTGTEIADDRIVEIAVDVYAPGSVDCPQRKVRRLNPGVPIPAEATEVHGITDADVADQPTFLQVARSLHDLLDGCDLAGYNVRRFDLPILVAEFRRAGLRFDPKKVGSGEPRRIIDLMALFFLEHPRDLAAAVRQYTQVEHDAHSADGDVAVLPYVLVGMMDSHPETVRPDLQALDARCNEFAPYLSEVERWFGTDLENPVFRFGKNKGCPLRDADGGYIGWMYQQKSIDQDVKEFVSAFLARRSAA